MNSIKFAQKHDYTKRIMLNMLKVVQSETSLRKEKISFLMSQDCSSIKKRPQNL